jgi:hypothetical protein
MRNFAILAAALMLGAIGPAQAGLVNVQFGGDFNSPQAQVGPAVIGSAGDVWNQMWGLPPANTGGGALVDSDGNATGLSISFTTQGWLQVPEGLTVWGTDYRNLMRGMIYTDTATTRNITITGLPANAEHELYVYAQGDSGSNGRQTKLTPAGGTPVITTATVATADTFILDQNYVHLDVMSDASGVLSIDYIGETGEANLNGLQLVVGQAPEPASLGLLATGGVLLAGVRRRRSRQAA